MTKKKITVRFGRIGCPVIKLKIDEGTTVKETIKNFLYSRSETPFISINGKKKSLDTILNNNDLLVMAYSIRGEATVRRNGNAWRIHANDKDDLFPSDFHAHNIETGEKLNLYNGYLYDPVSKKLLCALHKKDWLAILHQLKAGKNKNLSLKAGAVLISINKSMVTA